MAGQGAGLSRPLVETSLKLITSGQASTGAYLAAPGYDTYAYCWLRDGAFIAAAADAFGRHESAAAFHAWTAGTVERYRHKVDALEQALSDDATSAAGHPLVFLDDRLTLHTRFTLDGAEAREPWGDFQLDGYGFWLTSLAGHLRRTGMSAAPYLGAVRLVRRYLELTWEHPCYDSWEEYPARRHVTTWAAVAAGMAASDRLVDGLPSVVPGLILARLAELVGADGVLPKFVPGEAPVVPGAAMDLPAAELVPPGAAAEPSQAIAGHEHAGRPLAPGAIDGSSLLVLGPFGPFEPESATVAATRAAVEATLVVDGGVHRYLEDEYYGGGLWVVLAGALAVVQARVDRRRAAATLAWIEAQADERGLLPEQVPSHLRVPAAAPAWLERWGPPARPLLWSHAMYLLAVDSLGSVAVSGAG